LTQKIVLVESTFEKNLESAKIDLKKEIDEVEEKRFTL